MQKTILTALLAGVVGAVIAIPVAVYASHSFNDVPNSNTFHTDIAWLKDSGVTKGCNPPANTEFCPKDEVTREQMAAFMHRLASNRVVDAGTVDGLDADELMSVASAEIDSTDFGVSVTEVTTMNELTINAPRAGVLLIAGGANVNVTGGGGFGPGIEVYVDGAEVGAPMAAFVVGQTGHLSYTTAVEVSPGVHTVRHDVGDTTIDGLADASIFYNANNLTAWFVPNGSVATASAAGGDGSLTGE